MFGETFAHVIGEKVTDGNIEMTKDDDAKNQPGLSNGENILHDTNIEKMEDNGETSNLINNATMASFSDILLKPVEDMKESRLEKDNNNVNVINVYPTIHSNIQNTLNCNAVNGNFSSFNNPAKYLNINVNNQMPFVPIIYNTSVSSPIIQNYITLDDVISKEMVTSMQPILITGTQRCTSPLEKAIDLKKRNDDDDIIFVKEYKVDENYAGSLENKDCSVFQNRKRGKREPFTEKRKNPSRKAQMDKASITLAENLSIPPAVFNARVPIKRNKRVINNPKVVRQSCRTTGAILCPPSPLSQHDFRTWPSEGLHEMPWYNENTCSIEKFTRPYVSTAEVNERLSKRTTDKTSELLKSNCLATLTHIRLHILLAYVNELKEFWSIVEGIDKTPNTKENQAIASEKNSLDDVRMILYNTCELYCLLNGSDLSSVAKYIISLKTTHQK
ncbi:hypothetical protein FQA39_LY15294 [Lamprigera yunnana]|nr:hypothetical protein FQA39_LY15294 [Lamprigera yunnana]